MTGIRGEIWSRAENMKLAKLVNRRPARSGQPNVNGAAGGLVTRLATKRSEISAAQKLRYQVFCAEMSAKAGMLGRLTKREKDRHDKNCDHLLVIDPSRKSNSGIVGTQRFATGNAKDSDTSFYSQSEFAVDELLQRHPGKRFMELGRSCILPEYRNKRTMELMWHGTWDYALKKQADIMFGCASFHADTVDDLATPLGFLVQNAAVGEKWEVSSSHRHSIDLSKYQDIDIDQKTALRSLPTLIKGYLRLGAKFSTVAVQDIEFGTIDVLVVLPVKDINPKYVSYYGEAAERHRSAA